MKIKNVLTLICLTTSFFSLPTFACNEDLEVVPYVDLARYTGTWHEIAAFPQIFEYGCYASTATYLARPDGQIDVINKCNKGSFEGPLVTAQGIAWVTDTTTNAKLDVQFFWPLTAKYWIIELDENYQWAMVGNPNRQYLWILARTKKIDASLLNDLIARAQAKGFDTSKLMMIPQPD